MAAFHLLLPVLSKGDLDLSWPNTVPPAGTMQKGLDIHLGEVTESSLEVQSCRLINHGGLTMWLCFK